MKATNLDFLFIDQIRNFAHLLTSKIMTKEEFFNVVSLNYSFSEPKTQLFIYSLQRSDFETIRLNNSLDSILFNQ